jgi:hypothetical protein
MELRIAEQPVPVLVLLHLILLYFGKSLSGLVLPLLVLVEHLLNGGLVLFNAS